MTGRYFTASFSVMTIGTPLDRASAVQVDTPVVGHRHGVHLEARGGQLGVKAAGIADAGNRPHRLSAKDVEGAVDAAVQCSQPADPGLQARTRPAPHAPPFTSTRSTVRSRAAPSRKRPGRQQEAVAQPALAIEHGDLQVPVQPVVLEAVVRDDDVRRPPPSSRRPAATRSACTQTGTPVWRRSSSGSSPTSAGIVIRPDQPRLWRRPSAVAAADDAGTQARRAADARQPGGDRASCRCRPP